jgi:hypothetical protein
MKLALSLSLALAMMTAKAGAEPYAVGDRMEPFALEDQHGESRPVDESVAMVLFGRDMATDKIVKAAFEKVDAGALHARQVVYVADIEGMPRLVAKLFALPSMRKRGYPMLLDRDGKTTARLPDVAGTVTVLHLDRLKITRVEHLTEPAEVRKVALGR